MRRQGAGQPAPWIPTGGETIPPRASRHRGASRVDAAADRGLILVSGALDFDERDALLAYLEGLRPLWEQRWTSDTPERPQRRLLRPVYWLGSWQFACLDYYRPPERVADRCVAAEPYPPVIASLVSRIEALARERLDPRDIPSGWSLDTCLVNFYGERREAGRWVDAARVGDHRDFEPGPVASISLGERALFQFVTRSVRGEAGDVVRSVWLDDASLQIFAGRRYKHELLHRVARVDGRGAPHLGPEVEDFRTRRINLTFRHVPPAHVTPFAELGAAARDAVRPYVQTLASASPFFAAALEEEQRRYDPQRPIEPNQPM
jgi:alkylated DNA repair dioxygenase AlkB